MPFLMRVAADAAIIAFGLAAGKKQKSGGVFGSHGTASMPQKVYTSEPLILRVSLSRFVRGKTVMARYEVEGTAVCGTFQLTAE